MHAMKESTKSNKDKEVEGTIFSFLMVIFFKKYIVSISLLSEDEEESSSPKRGKGWIM